jgi:hypothetical protein
MTIFDRLKTLYLSFLAQKPEEFPPNALPQNGRQSVDSNAGYLAAFNSKYGYINPIFDAELLQTIQNLALYNPDFTQFVNQMISLGNQGHTISVQAATSQNIESVITRINERSANLYKSGAGVDGLLNAYGRQLAEAGAVSSEDVVDLQARCVSKVVIVPTDQIRFRYEQETDQFVPIQMAVGIVKNASGNLIDLNPLTYAYYPWVTPQNSPYAIPPGLGAVDTLINSQAKILASVPHIANKQSLLGLLSVLVPQVRNNPNETPEEYTSRSNKYLAAWKAALSGNISNGLLIAFKGTEVNHTPTSGDSQGFSDIHQISEEQVFSGLNVPASLMGRSYAVAETWAKVVYEAYKGYNKNLWLPAKRRHERTLRLDCRLAGLSFDSISLTFNKMPSLNPKEEAEAVQVHTETELVKAGNGMVSPDEAAQACGYEGWFDPSLINGASTAPATANNALTAKLVWNSERQKYDLQRERIEISTNENLVDLAKKKTKVLDFQRSK